MGYVGGVKGVGRKAGRVHLRRRLLRTVVATSREREATESPSMTARLTQMTHPLAPSRQSMMGPGAQPRERAIGPSTA